MERTAEDMKIWLFDLTHGNLSDSSILQGFIKYYVLYGLGIGHVQDNLVFRTHYSPEQIKAGMEVLKRVLNDVADSGI